MPQLMLAKISSRSSMIFIEGRKDWKTPLNHFMICPDGLSNQRSAKAMAIAVIIKWLSKNYSHYKLPFDVDRPFSNLLNQVF